MITRLVRCVSISETKMTQKRDAPGLSKCRPLPDNRGMEELLNTLMQIGVPANEIQRVSDCYRGDVPGLKDYVLYMRAMLDDRHEYLD
jgi:hypothetical protein